MSENRIFLSPPHVGDRERQLLLEAFDSNWIAPLGPQVDAFEREMASYVGVSHAAALSCGTAAIHIALMLLEVPRGAEVLTSTLTFSATANAITYCGAQPVFIDSSESTWNMDPDLLAEELDRLARSGRLPAAVMPVDIYGQCADFAPIRSACEQHGVPLIEDSAESLGATYGEQKAGALGDLGVLSFNGNKILTSGGGGMLLSNNKEWIDRARFLATQARDQAPHYQHSQIGYNYRLSNLLAAVGRGQLAWLDERIERRRRIRKRYQELLADQPGTSFMPEAPYGRSNAWLTCILVDPTLFGANREDIRLALAHENIEARPMWKPMHLQPVFQGCRTVGRDVASRLFDLGLCLPSSSSLADSDVERIVGIMRAVSR